MGRESRVVFDTETYGRNIEVYGAGESVVIGIVTDNKISRAELSPEIARKIAITLLNLSENLEDKNGR